MSSFIPYFMDRYYHEFRKPNGSNPLRDRSDGFLTIINELDQLETVRILETGTMRGDHGDLCFGDDGCSTYLFDDFVDKKFGQFISIDINEKNIEYSKKLTKNTQYICGDSVKVILNNIPSSLKLNLVYLDSFDYETGKEEGSRIHQFNELCAVMKNVKTGTIIASDDYNLPDGRIGKGYYVNQFMQQIGAKLLHSGYILVYKL